MTDPYVIAGHIRQAIRGILDNYEDALNGAKATDESGIRGSGDAVDPASADAIDARAEAHKDLVYYARFILGEVNGGTIATKVDASSVTVLAGFVDIWSLALCEQHPADALDCRRDMQKSHNRLKSLANGERSQRIAVGRCPEVGWNDSLEQLDPCTGSLWATLRVGEATLAKEVACDANPDHAWKPWEWLGLGARVVVPEAS